MLKSRTLYFLYHSNDIYMLKSITLYVLYYSNDCTSFDVHTPMGMNLEIGFINNICNDYVGE